MPSRDPVPPADATSTPEILLDELRGVPEEERGRLVSGEARYANPALAHKLMEMSLEVRYESPGAMLHWADLARSVAERASEERPDDAEGRDLNARTWGYFGNALRVCGHLRESEEAFATAERLRIQGTGDPLLKARLHELTCSLCIFLRDFGRALKLSEEVSAIYEAVGDSHSLGVSMTQGATAHLYSGAPERAVSLLNRALPLLDITRDPLSLLTACHNLVRCYIDLGMPEQALTIYRDVQHLYKESDDTLILLRLRWQQGMLLRDIGSLEAAEEALLAARAGFQRKGLVYEGAVVSLDLAVVQTKLGLASEARRTSSEALSTFRALHIDREALASLILALRSFSR